MVTKKGFIFVAMILSLGTISAHGQTPSAHMDTIKVHGTDYSMSYVITNGQITQAIAYTQANSLIILASGTGNSVLTVTLPRDLIDAKIGDKDSAFMITDDGLPIEFQESKTDTSRTLTISFNYSTNPEIIMITGTHVVPEFGTIASLVLIIAIISIILVSTRTKLRFMQRY
ncbi:MAG TPA: PEFG-CTERM sorting domain-containing protein [Nitrosopumilaceae archaeon]|nr:PEFG-CTERM sorting domain-containing protein [Nitrosopumilaceae archaeon]